MTVSTQSSQITVATLSSVGPFTFSFIGVSSSDITVSAVASNGSITPLLSSQYSISLNAANPNSLWGFGGSVTLNSTPSYPQLIIERILPLTQEITTQNQGNYYAQVTEQALDILEMQIQQVSNRTTQFRGIWTTNTDYTVGDIVQDGANGLNTGNYYICQVQNTSGVWATDLAGGYWALSVVAYVPNTPITLSGAVTGTGTTNIPTVLATEAANSILANSSATSGAPVGLVISASNLVGRSGAGNISAISLGNNLSLSGTVLNAAAFSGGSGITIGMTSISSGNNGAILYDNGGTLGQIAVTGSSLAVLNSSPAISNATLSSAILTAPTLGTPISGNLANCTNIPVALMTAFGVGCLVFASDTIDVIWNANSVVAGSHLTAYNLGGNNLSLSLSGSWQALAAGNSSGGAATAAVLWQRIA